MGEFCLILHSQSGKPLGPSEDHLSLDDTEIMQLNVIADPYQDHIWAGETLNTLIRSLELQVARLKEEVTQVVLEKVKKPVSSKPISPWIHGWIEEAIAHNQTIQNMEKLLNMLKTAYTKKGQLYFFGD